MGAPRGGSSRRVLACLAAALCLALCAGAVRADRGHIVIQTLRPDVAVSNVAQKAIIGWNGYEEVLILATDLSAGAEAKVLEFLPLPAKPSEVELAEGQCFSAVERIIAEHTPPTLEHFMPMRSGAVTGPPPAVEIVFHEKIGPHDITIARVRDLEEFLSWAGEFVRGQGGSLPEGEQEGFRWVVASYLDRGYDYFVFDVIELGRETKTVPPIRYRFPSDHLFFPLLVSSLDEGETEISLFLFTPHRPVTDDVGSGFRVGRYRRTAGSAEGGEAAEAVQFWLRHDDITRVSDCLADLFEGGRDVCFTAVGYEGPAANLATDFILAAAGEKLPLAKGLIRRLEWRTGLDGRLVPGSILEAAWSPEGDRLCVAGFSIQVKGRSGYMLTVLDVRNGPAAVISPAGWVSEQCWSPDGSGLCYLGGYRRNVWLADVEGVRSRQLTDFSDSETDPPVWGAPAWSPSGEWIAFAAFGNLCVVRPDGNELRRLTELPEAHLARKGEEGGSPERPGIASYAWSPDGRWLAYVQPEEGAGSAYTWTVHRCDPETGATEQLLDGQAFASFATGLRWQPKGGRLAFAATASGEKRNSASVTSGDDLKEQAPALAGTDVWGLVWMPDGEGLITLGPLQGAAGGYGAAVLDLGTGDATLFAPSHFLCAPETRPHGFRPGGEELCVSRYDQMFVGRLDGSGWRELGLEMVTAAKPGRDPGSRWGDDPAVREAAEQWRRYQASEGEESEQSDERLFCEVFHELYGSLGEEQRHAMEDGQYVLYRELTPEQQGMLVSGLAYRAVSEVHARGTDDPSAIRVPEWYWWLEESRVRLSHRADDELVVSIGRAGGGPGGERISAGKPRRLAMSSGLWEVLRAVSEPPCIQGKACTFWELIGRLALQYVDADAG